MMSRFGGRPPLSVAVRAREERFVLQACDYQVCVMRIRVYSVQDKRYVRAMRACVACTCVSGPHWVNAWSMRCVTCGS